MVGWLATSPRTGLVLDDMQVVSVQVAVALCADVAVAPGDLGPMAAHRVPLGPGMNALSGRLRLLGIAAACPGCTAPGAGLRLAARDGERVDAAPSGDRDHLRPSGRAALRHPGRVVVRLSPAERDLLRAACERLLGLLDGRVLDLTDERTQAVRVGIEQVLAALRQPPPAPSVSELGPSGPLRSVDALGAAAPAAPAAPAAHTSPAPTGPHAGSCEPAKPAHRPVRNLMPGSIWRSMRNSAGSVGSPLIRLYGASE